MKNKILIHEDSLSIETDIQVINENIIPAVNSVIAEIKKLNIGEATQELVSDALFENSSKISGLFRSCALNDASGVINPILRQNLLNGVDEAIMTFRNSVEEIKRGCNRDLIHHITIQNETAILTDQDKEDVAQRHRKYVSKPEAEMFELHKKIASDLCKLFENTDSSLYSPVYMSRFFVVEDWKFVVNPGTNYSELLKQQKAVSE